MIGRRDVDGFEALTVASPDSDGIELTMVPGAGMVGCSLSHRGEELLGQRGGLATYVLENGNLFRSAEAVNRKPGFQGPAAGLRWRQGCGAARCE